MYRFLSAILCLVLFTTIATAGPKENALAALALAAANPPAGSPVEIPKLADNPAFEPKGKAAPQARALGCGCENGGPCTCGAFCECDLSHDGAINLSLRTGKPLIDFFGQPSRPLAGCVSHAGKASDGKQWVEVGLPNKDRTEVEYLVLLGTPTDAAIREKLVKVKNLQERPPARFMQPIYYQQSGCAGGRCR